MPVRAISDPHGRTIRPHAEEVQVARAIQLVKILGFQPGARGQCVSVQLGCTACGACYPKRGSVRPYFIRVGDIYGDVLAFIPALGGPVVCENLLGTSAVQYPDGGIVGPDAPGPGVVRRDQTVQVVRRLPALGVGYAPVDVDGVGLDGGGVLGGYRDGYGVPAVRQGHLVTVRNCVGVGGRDHHRGAQAVGGGGHRGLCYSAGHADLV